MPVMANQQPAAETEREIYLINKLKSPEAVLMQEPMGCHGNVALPLLVPEISDVHHHTSKSGGKQRISLPTARTQS